MQIDALLKDFVVKANLEDFIFLGITNKNVLYFRVMHVGEAWRRGSLRTKRLLMLLIK
ncbi:MAG: hypothetical protein JRC67_03745 [Deltaproteobacteria bacterium]|nr:hypothetical protein [Deltaproteobacteria bacterium]